MNRIFIFHLLWLLGLLGFSQKQGDVWFFGKDVLMDFASGGPVVTGNGNLNSIEASSSVASPDGSLICYSNGWDIKDKNHQTIQNWAISSQFTPGEYLAQGTLLLSLNDSIILFFTIGQSPTSAGFGARYMFKIDSKQNNGLGSIDPTQIIIADSVTENFAAIRHANGKSWWLISHKATSNVFYKWHILENGTMLFSRQDIGAIHPQTWLLYQGQLTFNPKGDQFAMGVGRGKLELYGFDRCSGEITLLDSIVKPPVDTNHFYGISFSPNGRFIYTGDGYFGVPGTLPGSPSRLFQYDLDAPNLQASESVIWTTPQCDSCRRAIGQHKLGPDGKIYVIQAHDDYYYDVRDTLMAIENPNAKGLACNFNPHALLVSPGKTNWGFPNIPNYRLGPLTPYPANAGPDQYYCLGGTPITLGVPDTSGGIVTYHWQVHTGPGTLSDTSTTQPSTAPSDTTTYVLTCIDVTLGPDCGTTTDTVTVFPRQPIALDAGPDGTICLGDAEPTSITLGPANSNNELCHWESEFGLAWTLASLDDPTSCNPVAKPYETTVYTLVSQDIENGCPEMRDQVTVTVEPCDIEIPNVITPNGDGINDVFFIKNLPPGSRVFVYDRWGSEVYGSDNYGNDWVPKASLPEGVYYYRVQSVSVKTGVVAEKVGTLTLLR